MIVAFVFTTCRPAELSIAVLLIELVVSLIAIGVDMPALLPTSLTILLAIEELARVDVSILPGILSIALSFTPGVLSDIDVSADELVAALAVTETSIPLTFVLVTVAPDVLAEPVRLVVCPLADVGVAL